MPQPQSKAARLLASRKLGVGSVIAIIMCSTTPLTVNTGVIPSAYGATGITALPAAVALVALVFIVFFRGFLAMSQEIPRPGAFYTYIARELNKSVGVAGAWIALVAYTALYVGLFGAFGEAGARTLNDPGVDDVTWWMVAFAALVLVGIAGWQKLSLNATVLLVLLIAEIVWLLVTAVANFAQPAEDVSIVSTLDDAFWPAVLSTVLVAMLIGVIMFVGVESGALFTQKTRDPKRTVQTATRACMLIMLVLYVAASWGLLIAYGPQQVVAVAREQGPEMVFVLAGQNVAPWWGELGRYLFLAGMAAAMLSFHLTVTYYAHAVGTEGVISRRFGTISARTGAPGFASVVLSGVGFVVICTATYFAWKPTEHLFYAGGAVGALGVLILLVITSVTVFTYFRRNPGRHSSWTRQWAPGLAGLALAVVLVAAVLNFETILGIPGSPLRWGIPAALVVILAAGVLHGMRLKAANPIVYAGIGTGCATPADSDEPAVQR